MRIIFILPVFFVFLLIVQAASEKISLTPGRSFTMSDRNVSLVVIEEDSEKVIFCVNGKKGIVEEDDFSMINNVRVEILRIRANIVDVQLDYTCEDCVCGDECDNSVCFDEGKLEIEEELRDQEEEADAKTEEEIVEAVNEEGRGYIEPVDIGIKSIVFAVLIILILILGLIVLWKKT